MPLSRFLSACLCTQVLFAQTANTEGTRQLYYLASPSKDSTPPPLAQHAETSESLDTLHLGVRYNVVLIGRDKKAQQVPSDHSFQQGDCFAIDLQSNRSAYLYVLARQSSGSWTPLTDMPGQQNALPQGKRVRIPAQACFEVHNPPGKETLFVVLSRDPKDFYELFEGIKGKETYLNAAVKHLEEKFGDSRDITIAHIEEPERADEPKGAVYVVNTSKIPTSTLVTKIEIRHH